MSLAATARLLTLLRLNSKDGRVGLLSIECLLLVADGPKTLAELERLTGSPNGRISTAVRSLCPWYSRKDERVVEPVLPLLKRVKRPDRRAPVVHLSAMGEQILREAGLICEQ